MSKLMGKASLFAKKNAPTMLTVAGAIGTVATTVIAVKATPKALSLLNEAQSEKGDELTKLEILQVAAPVYIPSLIIGATSLACIIGSNVLNRQKQASMASAYALLDSSYKQYKTKAKELYGEDVDQRIKEGIAVDKFEANPVRASDGTELFYDYYSERYFESTIEKVQQAEYRINRHLATRDYAYLNEFYEELGIEPIDGGWALGWSLGSCLDMYWQSWIDFTHDYVELDDGLQCHIITIQTEPIPDFEDYC